MTTIHQRLAVGYHRQDPALNPDLRDGQATEAAARGEGPKNELPKSIRVTRVSRSYLWERLSRGHDQEPDHRLRATS